MRNICKLYWWYLHTGKQLHLMLCRSHAMPDDVYHICRCRRGLVTAANFLVWLWETWAHSGAVLGWVQARARQVACDDENMAKDHLMLYCEPF